MLPFCGYHMGDYFQHWVEMRKLIRHPPRVFHVNWFRKNAAGEFLWPGYGENMRVLKWIVDRCEGRVHADETELGWMPRINQFDLEGMTGYSREKLEQAQSIVLDEWRRELLLQDDLFLKLYSHMPKELVFQKELLTSRL